jgi:hypothetical protein
MLPTISRYDYQGVAKPYQEATKGIRMLRNLDGKPGDQNANPNAISVDTPLGQLDAVVFSNPDGSQTVVQRSNRIDGQAVTTWLDVPKKGNGIPNLSGFEITTNSRGLASAIKLDVKETWGRSGGIPTRTYNTYRMKRDDISNSLLRADVVLASFKTAPERLLNPLTGVL